MNKEQMHKFIRVDYPVTVNSVEIIYKNGEHDFGYFTDQDESFNNLNQWRFVPNNSSVDYRNTKSNDFTKVINGDDLLEIRYL